MLIDALYRIYMRIRRFSCFLLFFLSRRSKELIEPSNERMNEPYAAYPDSNTYIVRKGKECVHSKEAIKTALKSYISHNVT